MIGEIMDIAAMGLTPNVQDALVKAGVPVETIDRLRTAGILGRAWVRIEKQRWSLADRGEHGCEPRLILGIYAVGELIDLVAISGRNENQWTLYAGMADFLGHDAIEAVDRDMAAGREGRLALHATPMDWLRAGGHGACVVDWTRAARNLLRSLGEAVVIEVSHPIMAGNLDRQLRHGGLPKIEVAEQETAVAA